MRVAAAVEVSCFLGMAERGEQQAHKEHVGVPRLQGGWCAMPQRATSGRRANLVCCVWMAMVSEVRAALACASIRDHAHAAEATEALQLALDLNV